MSFILPEAGHSLVSSDPLTCTPEPGWGNCTPTTPGEFNCFGVFVDSSHGVQTAESCRYANNVLLAPFQRFIGFAPGGAQLQVELNTGSYVRFYLVSANVSQGHCYKGAMIPDHVDYFSKPQVLDFEIKDIVADQINTIKFEGSVSTAQNIDNCVGQIFPWTPNPCNVGSPVNYNDIGAGTPGSPHIICNDSQLSDIGTSGCNNATSIACGLSFQLGADIDLITMGSSFIPIGGTDHASVPGDFTGDFNGSNKTISNMTLALTTFDKVGLFRSLGSGSTISNLNITNGSVVGTSSSQYHGTLAGYANGTTVGSVIVSSSIVMNANQNAGGLIGMVIGSSISMSAAGVDVDVDYGVGGGLVGSAATSTTITSSSSSGTVDSANSAVLGGLVGIVTDSDIDGCYSSSAVTSGDTTSGLSKIGGLVETYENATSTSMRIFDSYSTGAVTNSATTGSASHIGGLVGSVTNSGSGVTSLERTYSSSALVAPLLGDKVGGLIGETITSSGSMAINQSFAANSSITVTGSASPVPEYIYTGSPSTCGNCKYNSDLTCSATTCTDTTTEGGVSTASLQPASSSTAIPWGDGAASDYWGSSGQWTFTSGAYPTLIYAP